MIVLGRVSSRLKIERYVPLAKDHEEKSAEGIKQVVYDRFFTPIEKRTTSVEIEALTDVFSAVLIAESPPYWHFLCQR